ncbi:MAG TPA: hypothetical protein P5567_07565 [Kiritimatiellia bacterium]|nr:hypothetical protein [Kiritimatiellia bacterium]HSA17945.1 hypothetical protein [Kiritimatiellia bacterium]
MDQDKKLTVGIEIPVDTAGAAAAEQAIDGVKQAALETGRAIEEGLGENMDARAVRDLAAAEADVKAATADLAAQFDAARTRVDELAKAQDGLAEASDTSAVSIRNQSQAIDAIVKEFPRLQAAFTNISAVLVSGLAGAAVGKTIYDSIVTPIWNAIEGSNKAVSQFALESQSKLKQIGQVEVTFDNIVAASSKAQDELDKMLDRVRQAKDTGRGVSAARSDTAIAAIELQRQKDLLVAGDNEELKSVIDTIAGAKKQIEALSRRESEIASDITAKEKEREILVQQIAEEHKKTLESSQAATQALDRYKKLVGELEAGGIGAEQISSPRDRDRVGHRIRDDLSMAHQLQASGIDQSDVIPQLERQEQLVTDFIGALGAASKAQLESTRLAKESADTVQKKSDELNDVVDRIAELQEGRKQVATERETLSVKFDPASSGALKNLEDKIAELTRTIQVDRQAVSAAVVSGDPEAQAQTQAKLKADTDLLGDLQAKYNAAAIEIRNIVSSLGKAASAAVADMGPVVESVNAAMSDTASAVKDGAAKAVQTVQQSGDDVLRATDTATGQVGAAIRHWGESVVTTFAMLKDLVMAQATEISSIRAQADSAKHDASIALSQIRNGRE